MKPRIYRSMVAVILLIRMLFSFPVTARADERVITSGDCGENLTWVMDTEGTMTISGTGPMEVYEVPEDVPWAANILDIKKVIIEDGVTSIGDWAFFGAENLEEVVLAKSVTAIGLYVFGINTSLTAIDLPEGITRIEDGLFNGSGLTRIVIPKGVTYVGDGAFAASKSLREIVFTGDAPEMHNAMTQMVTATVYYPSDNQTWTYDKVGWKLSGELTWIGYHESDIYRIYGDDRCKTAFEIAEEMKSFQGNRYVNGAIFASADNFADALAASYLAAELNIPILLYRPAYLEELQWMYFVYSFRAEKPVYIVGGTAAVPAELEAVLGDMPYVRLAGETRFDTNLEILKEAGVTGGEILVATGWNFADSLSASAVGKPILLVNSITGELTENQKAFLSTLENATFTIIGGAAAVGEELAEALAVYGPVERISGNTREETSVKVAERYFENPDRIVLAYSRNFPDGLCGGPLAHVLGAPLILTNAGQEGPAAEYVAKYGITKGAILGGSAALTDETVSRVFAVN